MPLYLVGVVSAFAEPVFHGWANILDYYFSAKVFERLTVFIFLSEIFNIALLPVIWVLDPPTMLSGEMIAIAFLLALTEVFYLYPYYWALQEADTSIVASLFGLGRIFIPLLAFFIVGERLTMLQYAGFFLIVFSSVFLTVDIRKMRLNKAFVYMLLSSLILALQSVVLKYLFDQGVGWGSAIVWITAFELVIVLTLMLMPKNRRGFGDAVGSIKGKWGLFVQLQATGWLGNVGSSLALFFIPVSIAKAIASTQPAFPLIYALFLGKKYPHLFREQTRDGIGKKSFFLACIIIGTILAVY